MRIIFNGVAAILLVMGLAAVVLGVRSFWVSEALLWSRRDPVESWQYVRAVSGKGGLAVHYRRSTDYYRSIYPKDDDFFTRRDADTLPGFSYVPLKMRYPLLSADESAYASNVSVWGFQWVRGREVPGGGTVASLTLPWPVIAAALLTWPVVRVVRSRRKRRWATEGRCPACGYDMRATPGRCPECGREALATTTT